MISQLVSMRSAGMAAADEEIERDRQGAEAEGAEDAEEVDIY